MDEDVELWRRAVVLAGQGRKPLAIAVEAGTVSGMGPEMAYPLPG